MRTAQSWTDEGRAVALAFAFQNLGAQRVISLIHPEKQASLRVAGKLGGTHAGGHDVGGQPALVYEYT